MTKQDEHTMKNVKSGLLISLLMFHPYISAAGENDNSPGTNNGLGFDIAALVGGLIAGPRGFIIGTASGATLAFSPEHLFNSSQPGEHGNVIISGHQDTHFVFL